MKKLNSDEIKERLYNLKNELSNKSTNDTDEEAEVSIFIEGLVDNLQEIFEKINVDKLAEGLIPILEENKDDDKKDT